MSAKVTLEGLEELREALRSLPADLTREAEDIVVRHATQAEQDIQSNYPRHTGNLKQGMRMEVEHATYGVSARVRSTAKHAFIFENGTVQRKTRNGANRGAMPAASSAQAFIPQVIRQRRAMTADLIALVERAGFQVSTY